MARLLCLTTGGTIAAARDDAGALVTARAGAAVVGAAADVETVEVARSSSTVLGLGEVFGWAQELARRLREPAFEGAVVTVGTETLPEVAYLLGLAVGGQAPLVVTGAMLPPDDPAADGPANLAAACRLARDARVRGAAALVVMGGEVHAAAEVVKVHATAPGGFVTPVAGPLGRVAPDGAIELCRALPAREHLPATRIEERVALVRAVLGGGPGEVDGAVAAGARGLVLETFPAGGVPPGTAGAVERALEAGVAVVAASRSAGGPVTAYAGVGEGRWLAERGVRLVRDLEPARARVRLALALGLDDPAALATVFP